MKFRTSKKDVTNKYSGYYYQIVVGYCDMQYLLSFQNKIGSNAGVYGWNYNIYAVNGVAICTGYRGMPGVSVDHKIITKYERKAEKIRRDWSIPYEKQVKKINNLLYKFLEEVTQ